MKNKLKVIQILLALSFLLFVFFLLKPKSYIKEYKINDVLIKESFNKKGYYFEFNYKDKTLDFFSNHKYRQSRGLVKDINIVSDNENFCIIPSGKNFDFIPLCLENREVKHYTLVNDDLKEQIPKEFFVDNTNETSYEDIKIFNEDYTYLVWNYNGFYYLNKSAKKKIELFNSETYNASLIGYTKDYLVIADYDANYTFNRMYTISFKNGEVKEYKLKRDIYFDSYFIGYKDNDLYIVDNKESLMYEFNAKNGKIAKTKSRILENGTWKDKNIKTLINKKQSFTYETNYEYSLEHNNIYLNYKDKNIKTLVASDVKNIVRIKENEIFYLKNETLYRFTPSRGEERLLSCFNWNFNFENIIYIN